MKTSLLVTALVVALGFATFQTFIPASLDLRQRIFEPQYMVHSFRTMSELFPSRTVARAERVSPLPLALLDLSSVSFSASGKQYQFEDLLAANRTQGLLVMHRGEIVYEQYFGGAHAGTRFTSWSVAKSFNSTLVGLAIGEGLIGSVNDQLVDYLPQLKNTAYDGVTIRQALQMSSGVEFSELYDGALINDVTRFMGMSLMINMQPANELAFSFPRAHEPGTTFNYNTAESQIIGMLVATVTGMPLSHYLQQKIWEPLGMSHDATWTLDQYGESGVEMGGCCLNAVLRDYARFGQLFLQDGIWEGRRVLPQGWVAEATNPDADYVRFENSGDSETGYQYQWWRLGDSAYAAEGVHGQIIYVNTAAEVVIAKTSAWDIAWPEEMSIPAIAGMHAIAKHLAEKSVHNVSAR